MVVQGQERAQRRSLGRTRVSARSWTRFVQAVRTGSAMPIPLESLVATTRATLAVGAAWRLGKAGDLVSRPRPGWYLRRLRGMSLTEVAYRTLDVGRRRIWARRQVRPGEAPALPPGVLRDRAFVSPLPASARASVPPDAASALVAGCRRGPGRNMDGPGIHRADSADPDWFHDPLTGRRAPDRQLAFRIDHRDEAETGNIKQVWEMSRHHQLTVLAAAWWLTQEERYAEAAARPAALLVDVRTRSCPACTGRAASRPAIRLISWAWARRLLDEWPKVGDLFEHNEDAVRQIAWHQEFLAAFPSRGSSANNHVVAEAAGRLVAACAFPWYARTDRWRRSAAALLERELAANTFADGLNRELATDYHRFVLELGLLAAVEADAHGHDLSEATWERLARCLMPAPPSWTPPGGPRGRVTATRGVPWWSTTRNMTHGPRSWARAPHCWGPGLVARVRRRGSGVRCSAPRAARRPAATAGPAASVRRRRAGHHAFTRARRSGDLVPLRRRPSRFPVHRCPRPRRCPVRRGPARRRRYPR